MEITGPELPPLPVVLARHKAIAVHAMNDAVLMTERTWKARAQRSRRTGHYLRSITHLVTPTQTHVLGVVGTNVEYARWLEEGTGLYGPRNQWIYPKHAQALRWPAGGGHTFNPSTGQYTGFANAPGFRLTGQQRQGAAGAGARYSYARRVRGIVPRRFARDAATISAPHVVLRFRQAGTQMAQALVRP